MRHKLHLYHGSSFYVCLSHFGMQIDIPHNNFGYYYACMCANMTYKCTTSYSILVIYHYMYMCTYMIIMQKGQVRKLMLLERMSISNQSGHSHLQSGHVFQLHVYVACCAHIIVTKPYYQILDPPLIIPLLNLYIESHTQIVSSHASSKNGFPTHYMVGMVTT